MDGVIRQLKNPFTHNVHTVALDDMLNEIGDHRLPCSAGRKLHALALKKDRLALGLGCRVGTYTHVQKRNQMVLDKKIQHNVQSIILISAHVLAIGDHHGHREDIPHAHVPKSQMFGQIQYMLLHVGQQKRIARPGIHGQVPYLAVRLSPADIRLHLHDRCRRALGIFQNFKFQLVFELLFEGGFLCILLFEALFDLLAVVGRRHPVHLAKDAVKRRQIGKPAVYCDLRHILVGQSKLLRGVVQPHLIDIIGKIDTGLLAKEARQRGCRDKHLVGQCRQADIALEIGTDIAQNFVQPQIFLRIMQSGAL